MLEIHDQDSFARLFIDWFVAHGYGGEGDATQAVNAIHLIECQLSDEESSIESAGYENANYEEWEEFALVTWVRFIVGGVWHRERYNGRTQCGRLMTKAVESYKPTINQLRYSYSLTDGAPKGRLCFVCTESCTAIF
jgi:hypothetical protein